MAAHLQYSVVAAGTIAYALATVMGYIEMLVSYLSDIIALNVAECTFVILYLQWGRHKVPTRECSVVRIAGCSRRGAHGFSTLNYDMLAG